MDAIAREPTLGTGAGNDGPVRVILIAGVAGSGKTTLGRLVAHALRLPILDLDELTNPLLDGLGDLIPGPHWVNSPYAATIRTARYTALLRVASDNVLLGQGAVLVAPFSAELTGGSEWHALEEALAPAVIFVVHVDGDAALLERRRAERGAARDAFRAADAPVATPAVPHLRIEAALSPSQQLDRVLLEVGQRPPVDPRHPLFDASFDAVLFDLDGTLVDSTPAVLRSWGTAADAFGFDAREVQTNHGQPAGALLNRLLGPEAAVKAAELLARLETTDVDGVTAIPGAARMLDALPEGAKAIVTSGSRAVATARLAASGLRSPATIVTADDVSRFKPDPEPYLVAARMLGVSPDRCLVVEDAPAGVQSARAAGCQVLGVGGTTTSGDLDADLWIDALDRVEIEHRPSGFGLRAILDSHMDRAVTITGSA